MKSIAEMNFSSSKITAHMKRNVILHLSGVCQPVNILHSATFKTSFRSCIIYGHSEFIICLITYVENLKCNNIQHKNVQSVLSKTYWTLGNRKAIWFSF